MYSFETVIERIKLVTSKSEKGQEEILADCNANKKFLERLTDDKGSVLFTLAKIADETGCSVDYLLGRTDNEFSHISPAVSVGDVSGSHNNIIGGSSQITITTSGRQATALSEIYDELDEIQQSKLLVYADNLKNDRE